MTNLQLLELIEQSENEELKKLVDELIYCHRGRRCDLRNSEGRWLMSIIRDEAKKLKLIED